MIIKDGHSYELCNDVSTIAFGGNVITVRMRFNDIISLFKL